jgi:glutaredoxin 2
MRNTLRNLENRIASLEVKDLPKKFMVIPGMNQRFFDGSFDQNASSVKETNSFTDSVDSRSSETAYISEFEGMVILAFEKPKGYTKQHFSLYLNNAQAMVRYFADDLNAFLMDEASDSFIADSIQFNKIEVLKVLDDRMIKIIANIDVESEKPTWQDNDGDSPY